MTGDLLVRDLISGETLRLTHNQTPRELGNRPVGAVREAVWPAISRDNKWVAYRWRNPDRSRDLRVVGLDWSGRRVLYRHEDVVNIRPLGWSPDGTQILVDLSRADRTQQIAMVSVADGSLQVLKSLGWWNYYPRKSLSPDGRYIAYDVEPVEGRSDSDIFLLAADGRYEIPLVEGPSDDEVLGWSLDGTSIFFSGSSSI